LQNKKKGDVRVEKKKEKGKINDLPFIGEKTQNLGQEQREVWEKPHDGWIKCNVDASFLKEEKNGAWGVVLQDHMGNFLLSEWDVMNHCQSQLWGKLLLVLKD
jgi:hypothetical protein